uniref:Solute carrier family 66 member 2 n=1 Tax=Acrobeloides nanus TaxID=290746 RepID=A0A914DX07_9BILA
MFLVDSQGLELVSLKDFLSNMLLVLTGTFMVIGGSIPYVFQYAEIHQRKNAMGFSLLVCLALCVANILRILFWFGKRFEYVLLAQSVLMIITMILMLEISVRMNRKLVSKGQRVSVWKGDVIKSFWKWNDLSSFIMVLAVFTLIASIITALLTKYTWYVETLGMVALFTEACLGLPQLFRNFTRRSTQGMSVKMVSMWLIGDLGKTAYFLWRSSPAQFWICSSLQITIDILILCQVYFYGRRTSRIPTYVPPTAAKL